MGRVVIVLVALAAFPGLASAGDEGGPDAAPAAQRAPSPDFLFAPPRGSVGIRWSWNVLRADSDWFGFVRDQLTLDHADFVSSGISGDVHFSITRRLGIVGSGEYTRHSADSEYRHFIGTDGFPINQTTRLEQATFTAGVRYDLRNRGRAVGSLAWIPARFVPYVGGGAGAIWYDLAQYGDFVDFEDFSVFPDRFPSGGWALTTYAEGGTDILLAKRVYATVNARYHWAAPDLDEQTWEGFDPLSLGGIRLSTGIRVAF